MHNLVDTYVPNSHLQSLWFLQRASADATSFPLLLPPPPPIRMEVYDSADVNGDYGAGCGAGSFPQRFPFEIHFLSVPAMLSCRQEITVSSSSLPSVSPLAFARAFSCSCLLDFSLSET